MGIATDEVFLTRAECNAREGRLQPAMNDLNSLLETRWKEGAFIPYTASDTNEALTIILNERRKELVCRGVRWMDIKRLNKEGANIILQRTVNGNNYRLEPNSPQYAIPLPADIIEAAGIPQNKY